MSSGAPLFSIPSFEHKRLVRHRTIFVVNTVADFGIGTSANPDSRGSDRVVANSNDREIRLDVD